MHFSEKCNSGRIAIQWFNIKHFSNYQYTKFQSYTFRVQKMCVFCTICDFGSPTNIWKVQVVFEGGAVKPVKAIQLNNFTDRSKTLLLLWIIYVFLSCVCKKHCPFCAICANSTNPRSEAASDQGLYCLLTECSI